jgi:dTDP-4-dehydrorhamnose 3,5-epimerase-like enzyme
LHPIHFLSRLYIRAACFASGSFKNSEETGAKIAVYRFSNLMGHSRPNYNSAVSTFCNAVANDLPFTVNDRNTELELLYIDDLVEAMFDLKMNCDDRGSFTELLKTEDHEQFSVNISKPGITKGQHWHNSKWEFFIVVSGHGLIQERKIGTKPLTGKPYEVVEFEVSGDKIQAVHMIPGWTHNIINLSDTENLVTVMWANESFDPEHPDTFGKPV